MTRTINLSTNEVLRAARDGYWMQTGHSSAEQCYSAEKFVPYKTLWSPMAARGRAPGHLEEIASSSTKVLRHSDNIGKRAGGRSWWRGLRGRRTSTSSGNSCLHWQDCLRQRAPLTCDFKHVLIPFSVFQLCQCYSCQRQLSLGELKTSQCLQVLFCLFLLISFSLEIAI